MLRDHFVISSTLLAGYYGLLYMRCSKSWIFIREQKKTDQTTKLKSKYII